LDSVAGPHRGRRAVPAPVWAVPVDLT